MRTVLTLAVSLVFGLTAAQTAINKTFSTDKNQKISLKFDYPELIKISTWDKSEVQILGTVNINENESNNAFQIKESKEGNSLVIEGKIAEMKNIPRRIKVEKDNKKLIFKTREEYQKYCKENDVTFDSMTDGVDVDIKLQIKVPKHLLTQIESQYGLVEVKDFGGTINVNAIYGGIDATVLDKNVGKLSAETHFGKIYSNLDAKFTGKDSDDFRTLVTATFGNGPQYNLESKYGNIYLRK
ncbi:hypothetical protein NAL32_19950 [Chryseobacterium sp. Ch-15]|uniref:Adhesin domain-containing protein n=1 Tax=Chryseobacterium muglaense TaxID=2893752 RepID=A0A9Q3UTZ9_9FLAO|nr:hypothetical protein [Chryseobacterium muglaense]MBD3906924.1 hypothetical protein [Chryseobacterium muglaense]MCC9033746.1 hypothetical protein [Chryseobacterium muglaense]MCM2556670.1 hypothetical protein [Chryseobacterium muglaense]